MKTFAVLCLVMVVGIHAEFVTLPPAENDKANRIADGCIAESGITLATLAEGSKGNFGDDDEFKNFTFCFFHGADIVTSNGQLKIDVALAKLPPGVDKDDTKELLESCKSKTGKDTADTVYEIFKCYFFGAKVHIKFDFF